MSTTTFRFVVGDWKPQQRERFASSMRHFRTKIQYLFDDWHVRTRDNVLNGQSECCVQGRLLDDDRGQIETTTIKEALLHYLIARSADQQYAPVDFNTSEFDFDENTAIVLERFDDKDALGDGKFLVTLNDSRGDLAVQDLHTLAERLFESVKPAGDEGIYGFRAIARRIKAGPNLL